MQDRDGRALALKVTGLEVDITPETVAGMLASLPDTPAPVDIGTAAAEAARIDAPIAGLDGEVPLSAGAVDRARAAVLRDGRGERWRAFY
ncbi:MAG: hypothetical protein ABIQ15_11720 [Nocardioides sp.]